MSDVESVNPVIETEKVVTISERELQELRDLKKQKDSIVRQDKQIRFNTYEEKAAVEKNTANDFKGRIINDPECKTALNTFFINLNPRNMKTYVSHRNERDGLFISIKELTENLSKKSGLPLMLLSYQTNFVIDELNNINPTILNPATREERPDYKDKIILHFVYKNCGVGYTANSFIKDVEGGVPFTGLDDFNVHVEISRYDVVKPK